MGSARYQADATVCARRVKLDAPPATDRRCVPRLELPGTRAIASVQVFVDRAVAVLPSFAVTSENALAITRICQRLDGIPLAIELAVARVQLLTTQQIPDRLDDALHLLAQNQPTSLPHHQTLQATMEWSYALLSAQEQILFRRLATFAGSFSLESAEAIGSGNGIEPDQVLKVVATINKCQHRHIDTDGTSKHAQTVKSCC